MPENPENGFEDTKRLKEAARLFRRIEDQPNDEIAHQDLQAFLARGQAERDAYARIKRGLSLARKGMERKSRTKSFALIGAVLLYSFAFYQPAKILVLADHATGLSDAVVDTLSGDTVTLDASSAFADQTDREIREINLLQGAAYFEVEPDPRRFVVSVGDVSVEALSTEFEVVRTDDQVVVAVFEGVVEVRNGRHMWRLSSGEKLNVLEGGHSVESQIAFDIVAPWRRDFLIVDGMTLGEAADIISRRVRGDIVVLGADLRNAKIAGGLDLSRPMDALRTLARANNARLRDASPVVTVIHQ